MLPGSVVAYTDDITIISTGRSLKNATANTVTLNFISQWPLKNGLIKNPSKCLALLIRPNGSTSCNFELGLSLGDSGS